MNYVHGGDIYTYQGMIDFSTNINPLGVHPKVMEAAKQGVEQMTRYPDSRCRKLRKTLSEYLKVPEECLVFGNGAADLLFSLVLAEKPKKALLLAPTFAEYEQALKTVGCEIQYYQLKEEQGFRLDADYLTVLSDEIDMIFLCSPDNPVGRKIDKKFLLEILKRCRKHQIRMVLDECFYEFLDEPEAAVLQDQISLYTELFLVRAFTKMHAMPGLRLGYGISGDSTLLSEMEAVRQPWSVSTAAQAAGTAAIKETAWVEQTRAFVKAERIWMEEQLSRIGVEYFPSEANYILLKSPFALFKDLKAAAILIRDCSNYRGLGKGYYRIAIRKRTDNEKLIRELMRIYGKEQ